MAELQENESVQALLKLLTENKMEGKAQDLSTLLFYVDGMERQFDAVAKELQAVKTQLADIKDSQNPIKKVLTGMVRAIESKLEHAREQLHAIKDSIVENAAKMVESVKQTGISALDKTVTFLGVRESLDAVRADLQQSIADTKKSIEKVETIGKELRSVGAHVKNVGRAITGKEQQNVDGGTEGRFQAAVLVPLRTSHKLLSHMQNATLAAKQSVVIITRWSSPNFRPSKVTFSILSMEGSMRSLCIFAALSESSCTSACCISVGFATTVS